jgi:DNA-directed RNA polymerase subunit RPC12/RpoP
MTTDLRCAQCDQAFATNRDVSGRRVRCHSCGLVQRIPERGDMPAPVPSTYQLAPMALVPSGSQPGELAPLAPSPQCGRSSRFDWLEYLRPWVFETSQVQGIGAFLVVLSAADLFMTFALLRRSPAFFESNPIAQWFIAQWSTAGMVYFKFSLIGGAILLSEIIERKRPGWGRFVLLIGCVGAVYAIIQGGRLYLGDAGPPVAYERE